MDHPVDSLPSAFLATVFVVGGLLQKWRAKRRAADETALKTTLDRTVARHGRHHPKVAAPAYELASWYGTRGRLDEEAKALRQCADAALRDPSQPRLASVALQNLVDCESRLGRYRRALRAVNELEELVGRSCATLLARADLALLSSRGSRALGPARRAEELLREVLSRLDEESRGNTEGPYRTQGGQPSGTGPTDGTLSEDDRARLHLRLSEALFRQGRLAEGAEHELVGFDIMEARRAPEDFASVVLAVGEMHLHQGRHEHARDLFTRVLDLPRPDLTDELRLEAMIQIAEVETREGRSEEAIDVVTRATDAIVQGRSATGADAHQKLGLLLLRNGDEDGAERHFVLAEHAAPSHGQMAHASLEHCIQSGDHEAAALLMRRLAETPPPAGQPVAETLAFWINLSHTARLTGHDDVAERALDRATDLVTDEAPPTDTLAGYYLHLATTAADEGDFAAAEDALAQSAALRDSADWRALVAHNTGYAEHVRGRYRRALAASEEALALYEATYGGPEHRATALCNAGLALAELGDTEAATERRGEAAAIVAANPQLAGLEVLLHQIAALVAASEGRVEDAVHEATAAVESARRSCGSRSPLVAHSQRLLAEAHVAARDWEAAARQNDLALDLLSRHFAETHPAVARARATRGAIRAERGELAEACRDLEDALEVYEEVGHEHARHLGRKLEELRARRESS